MNKISDILYMSINSIYIIKKVVYSCHFLISAPAPMLQKTKSPSPPSRFCNPRVCTDWKNRALLGFNSAIQIPRKSKKDRPNFVNGISSYMYIYIHIYYIIVYVPISEQITAISKPELRGFWEIPLLKHHLRWPRLRSLKFAHIYIYTVCV